MLSFIVRSSMKFRFLVVAMAVTLLVVGAMQLPNSQVDVFPEFAPPKVEVQTPSVGLTASEVEELVTVPLEEALNGAPGLDRIRSKSVPQYSQIVLEFEPGTDLLTARQEVAERISIVTPQLPTWASPPFIIQPLSSTSRVMKIGLSSESLSTIDMSMIAYWKIRAHLLGVPGVANVPIWGERIEMLQVQADPERMQANGVSLDQVMNATADSLDAGLLRFSDGGFIGTGGWVETPTQRLNVQHTLAIRGPDELGKVPVGLHEDGTPILLSDVADVVIDHQPLLGDAVINGGEGLMLIVEKLPWANTLDVTSGVEAALRDMQPGLPGMEIDTTIFRPATFVEDSIDNLSTTLIQGSLLVVLVLALFLFSWRSALISLVTIPLSLTASLLVLYWRGTTINTMVLAGLVIALGAVVDDAIVDTENIVRRLREHRTAVDDQRSKARVIFDASLEVRGAVVYASLIEALALLPVFFLTGLTGAFFRPLAMSYALAVLVSMVVALVTTPALSLIVLRNAKLDRREAPLVTLLQRGYVRILGPIIRRPAAAYVSVTFLVIAGVGVYPRLGQELLPEFKERDFLMHWVSKPDTSLAEEVRITAASAKELQAIPGVRNFGSHIGQAFLADEPYGVYFGENWISIDKDVDYDATLAQIQSVVDGYPGLRRDVQTYLKERIREVLSGSSDTIVVKLFGDDLETLLDTADDVKEMMAEVDGVVDENVQLLQQVPQVEVTVRLDDAERLKLTPGDVRRASATFVSGEEVGDIFRDGKAYDVNVWSKPEDRDSLTDIENIPLNTPDGGVVLLKDVADVRITSKPSSIPHEDGLRTITIGANVSGRDLGTVAESIEDRLEDMEMPLGYFAEVDGEYVERQEANRRLLQYGFIAAIGIFLLLLTSMRSARLAALSFFTLPMALVGGVIAAYVFGDGVLSLGSLVGFFTILGIVARNGIMQISHFQHLEEHEGETFGPALVMRGARERLAPIVMTALTTALALVPLLIAGNIAGQEIEFPMAIVILGGLVTSTLLNLFVVPSLYLQFGRRRRATSANAAAHA